MKSFYKFVAIALVAVASAGCTRLESGTVGLRLNAYKEVVDTELQPGKLHQTVIGDVIEFPVREISGELKDYQPLVAKEVRLQDFDMNWRYKIDPSAVAEIWKKAPRSDHLDGSDGNTYLMFFYMDRLIRNAVNDELRKHEIVGLDSKREEIERAVIAKVQEKLSTDGYSGKLTLVAANVRTMLPPQSTIESAIAAVNAANLLRVKETEVEIAKKESERMAALSANSGSSIAYMDAQARLNISEAIKAGKVNSIVVPYDFKGIVSSGK